MYSENEVEHERETVLHDRLYSESNCSGSNRRTSACDGSALRADGVDSIGYSNPAYGSAWCIWNRTDLSEILKMQEDQEGIMTT